MQQIILFGAKTEQKPTTTTAAPARIFFNALEATQKINQLQQIAILGGQEFLKQQTRVHLAPHGGTEGQPTAAYRARQSWQKRHS